MLLFDTVNAFPRVMLALAVITLLGPSSASVLLVIVVTTFPTYAPDDPDLDARRCARPSSSRRSARWAPGGAASCVVHILPNIIGPLLILASMDIPVVITIEAGLTFLGPGRAAAGAELGRASSTRATTTSVRRPGSWLAGGCR